MSESIVTAQGLEAAQLAARDAALNRLEMQLVKTFPAIECPVEHLFTPGLYSRTISMPKHAIVTSKIHKTEHQYVVTKGAAMVYTDESGWVAVVAPYHGVTKAGTRRVLVMLEDTIWATFHPTNKITVEEVEAEIIETHISNPYEKATQLEDNE